MILVKSMMLFVSTWPLFWNSGLFNAGLFNCGFLSHLYARHFYPNVVKVDVLCAH